MSSAAAFAQGGSSSSIAGVVVDPDGGLIPGATVVVKSDATAATSNTVTGSNGAFVIPALSVGTYTVTVSLQGFKTVVVKDVKLSAGVPANLRAKLELGGVSETVEVQAGAEVIQTTTAGVSTTINTKSITSLPVGSAARSTSPSFCQA